jgi:hypothetical protein
LYRDLLLQFLAELMAVTDSDTTDESFQRAFQTYFNDLRPWLTPADASNTFRAVFPLFSECTINEEIDMTTVRLSPEGEAFFRAWVRRQAVLTEAGRNTDSGRTH